MRREAAVHVLLLSLGGGLCLPQGTAQTVPPTVRIPRVSQPPRLDDFLSDACRRVGVLITDFRQREPGDGTPVSR